MMEEEEKKKRLSVDNFHQHSYKEFAFSDFRTFPAKIYIYTCIYIYIYISHKNNQLPYVLH